MCTPNKVPRFTNEPRNAQELLDLEQAARLTCEYEATCQIGGE